MKKLLSKIPYAHVFHYFPLAKELVTRDLKIKYRRSFLWSKRS